MVREKIRRFNVFFLDFFRDNYLVLFLMLGTWIKLIVANFIFFNTVPELVFYLSAVASVLLIYSWVFILKKSKVWFAVLISLVSSFVIWADIVYFRYFASLIKVEALLLAGQIGDVSSSVFNLINFWDILFFLDAFIVFFVYLKFKHKYIVSLKNRNITVFWSAVILSFAIITGVLFNDLANGKLNDYIYRNFDMNLIEMRYGIFGAHGVNTYRFLMDANRSIDEAEREKILDWVEDNKYVETRNDLTGVAKNKNVYMIQIESLQSFVIGMELFGREVTPNLNKLVSESQYFSNGTSEFGGGKTSDSDFAANTSIYPLSDSSVFVRFGKDDYTSLPKALKEAGYQANAYHAYKRDFWNRGVAFTSLGYDHFYAADEYEEGENIILGLNDESFYQQTLKKLPKESPSFNYLISLSSHHPFDMAPEFQLLDVPYDEAKYDYRTYHYLQAIHYADYALGQFIKSLKKEGEYSDSLIVVYGDHPATFGEYGDVRVKNTLGDAVTSDVAFDKVPYIFKLPNAQAAARHNGQISQVDLMPTILNIVGVKTDFPMLGIDVFNPRAIRPDIDEAKGNSEALIKYNLFADFY